MYLLKPSIPQYSVVVPVYRGATTLPLLTRQLYAFFTDRQLTFELIFVYDCGQDNSWEVLLALKAQYPDVISLVRLAHNIGQHAATLCGFTVAQGRFIITLDEDLQHPPHQIVRLIETQQSGNYDLVYGFYENRQHHTFRNIAAKVFARLISLTIPHLHPHITSFRLFKAVFARHAALMQTAYPFVDGHLALLKVNSGSCLVEHQQPNPERGSAYNLRRLVVHAMGILVAYTCLPKVLVALSALGWGLLGWYVINQQQTLLTVLLQNKFFMLLFVLLCLASLKSAIIMVWRLVKTKHRNYPIAETGLSSTNFR